MTVNRQSKGDFGLKLHPLPSKNTSGAICKNSTEQFLLLYQCCFSCFMDIDSREEVKTRSKYLFSALIQDLQRRDEEYYLD